MLNILLGTTSHSVTILTATILLCRSFVGQAAECIFNNTELLAAIDGYLVADTAEETKATYGEKIGDWCLDGVTDFTRAFATLSICDFPKSIRILYENEERGIADSTDCDNIVYDELGLALRSFNEPLDGWNTSSAESFEATFRGAISFNQPVDHFITDNVVHFWGTFRGAHAFNQPLTRWVTARASVMANMFQDAFAFNQPVSHFITDRVVFMFSMFKNAHAFNQPVSKWSMSAVEQTNEMFRNARAFNQPLNRWDMSAVGNMLRMFQGAESFQQNLCSWSLESMNFTDPNPNSTMRVIGNTFEGSACWNQKDPKDMDSGPLCDNCRVADCRAKLLKRCKCTRIGKSKRSCKRIAAKKSVDYDCSERENGGCICSLVNDGKNCVRRVLQSKRHCGELNGRLRRKLLREYLEKDPLCG